MEAFLSTIAQYYYRQYGDDISNCCFIFPNRRSSLYFRKHLSEVCDKPIFAPDCYTINDLFARLSKLQTADNLGLIFKLYYHYTSLSPLAESFDDFYAWGETLLSDFNDIDKYLVDAEQLFSNLVDLKAIDHSFNYLSEEQIAAIKRFWKDFNHNNSQKSRQHFLDSWKILAPLYKQFRADLKAENIAYEGMIYRSVIEDIKENKLSQMTYTRFIFVGLNAINPCEEALMKHLQDLKVADFHWDFCSDYVKDAQNKSSFFLQDNIKRFPQKEGLEFAQHSTTEFQSIAVPSNTGQTKIVQEILKEKNITSAQELEQTAVILSDEQLMLPMLHALPQDIEAYNITMGFPLKNTGVYALFNQLINLQKNARTLDGISSFYHKNVSALLHHPLIAKYYENDCKAISQAMIKHNELYPSTELLQRNALFEKLFSHVNNAQGLTLYLKIVIAACLKHLQHTGDVDEEENKASDQDLEREFLYHLFISISRFHDLLLQQSSQPGIDVLIRLLRKHIDGIAVPFYGEPLKGLQIMGILETRTLDFKHLIFLSFNEGVFPKTSPINTFIPHHLRYGFGLPTSEHQDAIFAYYFYRIIQRAESVTMIYDASSSGLKTGEVSRYLPQLKYIYQEEITSRSQNYTVELSAGKNITIKKDEKVMQKLNELLQGGGRAVSASSLNDYIDCKLKFYFKQVERLRVQDELKENIDESLFGTIFHHVAEHLYAPYENSELDKATLYKISKNERLIDQKIKEAFKEEFFKVKDRDIELKGRYLVIATLIKQYIIQLLKVDMKQCTFI